MQSRNFTVSRSLDLTSSDDTNHVTIAQDAPVFLEMIGEGMINIAVACVQINFVAAFSYLLFFPLLFVSDLGDYAVPAIQLLSGFSTYFSAIGIVSSVTGIISTGLKLKEYLNDKKQGHSNNLSNEGLVIFLQLAANTAVLAVSVLRLSGHCIAYVSSPFSIVIPLLAKLLIDSVAAYRMLQEANEYYEKIKEANNRGKRKGQALYFNELAVKHASLEIERIKQMLLINLVKFFGLILIGTLGGVMGFFFPLIIGVMQVGFLSLKHYSPSSNIPQPSSFEKDKCVQEVMNSQVKNFEKTSGINYSIARTFFLSSGHLPSDLTCDLARFIAAQTVTNNTPQNFSSWEEASEWLFQQWKTEVASNPSSTPDFEMYIENHITSLLKDWVEITEGIKLAEAAGWCLDLEDSSNVAAAAIAKSDQQEPDSLARTSNKMRALYQEFASQPQPAQQQLQQEQKDDAERLAIVASPDTDSSKTKSLAFFSFLRDKKASRASNPTFPVSDLLKSQYANQADADKPVSLPEEQSGWRGYKYSVPSSS